jgi:deazaflavin-dependent oxidoreductase (nitroreductase family)
MGAYRSLMKRLGHTRAFRAAFKRTLPVIDRAVSKATGGRKTFGATVAPTFILVHTGRKSGKEYRTPLTYVRTATGFALAGSNWGQEKHPAWSGNLIANGVATVIVDGDEIPVRAHLASPEERADLWPRFIEMWPAYKTYIKRAGGREIRLFLLDRA